MIERGPWIVALALALAAGYTDWRSRRIPNWLTVPALFLGLSANTWARGWIGLKDSLLGAGLALALLLPFVLLRGLGAGDWKLMGAVGACVGVHRLVPVLILTLLVNFLMAAAMVVAKKRVLQTLKNMAHMVGAIFTFQLPGSEVSLDNPEAVKVPFGVAAGAALAWYSVRRLGGL